MSLDKFTTATDEYFVQQGEAGETPQRLFIDLVKNNNTVVGYLVDQLWQPGTQMELDAIIYSPSMLKGTYAVVTAIGTTATAEPEWTAAGTTVSDGGVTYLMVAATAGNPINTDEIDAIMEVTG